MAKYVTKIRTESGDMQIDYNALANLPQSDSTLSQSGEFADAKVTGEKIKNINTEITSINEEMQNLDEKVEQHVHDVATSSSDGHMSALDKEKLDSIENGANNYSLPTADSLTLGGVTTTSDVTSVDGLTACPIIDGVPYYENTLESLGITATEEEINKLSGMPTVAEKPKMTTITLVVDGWQDDEDVISQTVNVENVTTDNLVIVSPNPGSDNYDVYNKRRIRCVSQGDGTLEFVCSKKPDIDIIVNVAILV